MIGCGTQLTLNGTYNTDFAETEVDALRVNLTRFSLFFPELALALFFLRYYLFLETLFGDVAKRAALGVDLSYANG